MADPWTIYTRDEVISFLENGNFEKFFFGANTAYITTDDYEICIESANHEIPKENVLLALEVLKQLDRHISMAQHWLGHFNVKHDRWNPDGLDAGFVINGIYIGRYETGGVHRPKHNGFTITFGTVNPYPCEFIVKYHKNLKNPFAVEEIVE